MTARSSLIKINKFLTDEEIVGLHFEGCPHVDDGGSYELLINDNCDSKCNTCWLRAIRNLKE